MAEYISKEKALKMLQMQLLDLEADQDKGEYSELCENRGARDALDEAIYDIRTIKAAAVQPVKHGKWRKAEQGYDTYVECSECGLNLEMSNYVESEWRELLKYCPYCGARMDLKDSDDETL